MHKNSSAGFIAMIAVCIVMFGMIAYNYAVFYSISGFVDITNHHEWRIQAQLNVRSCVSSAAIMARKDYFFEGNAELREFGCHIVVSRDHVNGTVSVRASSTFIGVSSGDFEQVFIIP